MLSARNVIGGIVAALGLLWASPALAAFPGADGMLAVQPQSGGGVLLVSANGRIVHRICALKQRCGTPRRPRWSPDGRAIVFAGPKIRIVYTDGSCLDCQFGGAPDPAFEPGGATISFIQHGRVTVDGIDGLRKPAPAVAGASDAVWSATGELAVVRHGVLWAGRPDRLRRIVVGAQPSWSPSGDRIAVAQRGWLVIVDVRSHRVHRLARGGAPAFSPSGLSIAFVAPNHRLMIVAARGGRARAVGRVRAVSVDWQPRPRGRHPGCAAPPGSRVIASTPEAVITQDGASPPNVFGPVAYLGCLRADGRERLLARFAGNSYAGTSWVTSAVLAAPYAALIVHTEDGHYGGQSDGVGVFNLRTGKSGYGGEGASCPPTTLVTCMEIDHVVVGTDGVSAAHIVGIARNGSLSTPLAGGACAPASTLCVAVALNGGLFTSQDPSSGAGSWSSGTVSVPSGSLGPEGVACPGQSLCVAAGGEIYTSSDPAGGASTWTPATANGSTVLANRIACPTVALCVATRLDGTIATSTDPTGGTAAWSVASIDANHSLNGVFCSTEPRCFMTDSANVAFTSSDPTGGQGAWTRSTATPAFQGGACVGSSLCVSAGFGEITSTTAPDAGMWTVRSIPDNLVSVSCPSSSECVAVGAQGALYVSTDPASDTWSHATIDSGFNLTSISCASTSLCMATDANGHVLTSTNPTADPSAWTSTLLDGDPCTDGHDCSVESIEASDANGVRAVDSSKLPGSGPFLTGLTLSGDSLSWSHDGSPETAQLTAP